MIKKSLTIALCLIIANCGGISVGAGVKFKKSVGAESFGGNPGFMKDVIKLSNGTIIGFERPISNCGAGITFFGIVLPVIPVRMTLNSCEKSFDINISGLEISNAKLKYSNTSYEPVAVEKLIEVHGQNEEYKYEYGKKFKFRIDNFWKFRMADDKAIIVSGKTKDGKEFTEELPVKWGVMPYNEWSFP
jgi:hypothetical protein